MPRPPRIEGQGIIYHIICRGNNKEHIFKEEAEKEFYIKQLKVHKKVMGYRIYGYVFMDNHFHLILQTMDVPLSKIMHNFNNRFSKHYNRKYQRTGHVFENRYKAIPVLNDSYMLSLLRYVHQNPVRAGICKYVREYKWSSDIFYRKNISGFIDIDLVLSMLSQNRIKAVREYCTLIEVLETADYENTTNIGEMNKIDPHPKNTQIERKTLDEILQQCCDGESFALIKKGSRKRFLTPYKLAYARNALLHNFTLKQIAENINMSAQAIYNLLERYEN